VNRSKERRFIELLGSIVLNEQEFESVR